MSRRALVLGVLMLLAVVDPGRFPVPPVTEAQSSTLTLYPVIAGLVEPLQVTHGGDGSNRLYIVEKAGTIRVLAAGQIPSPPYLDIRAQVVTENEQGLLGLAFDPAFAVNKRVYVYYTVAGSPTGVGDDTLARYRVLATDPNRLDPSSAAVLLAVPDPYVNHNGGMLAFGPDHYLYVGLGDGGDAGDPNNNAQNLGVLLGKMLRLDVSGAGAYAIPPSNPFANGAGGARPEIWAYGLRNPWRFSFDRQSGDLFIADVGQGWREEVDRQPAGSAGGQNYGWRVMEGFVCLNPISGCDQSGKTLPIFDYGHGDGCSVTGGYVYRGSAVPSLQGAYIFGDYCSGKVWSLRQSGGTWSRTQLLDTAYFISSFGEDEAGELYLTDLDGGTVYRLSDPNSPAPAVVTAPSLPPVGPPPTVTPPPSTGADLSVTAFSSGTGPADQAIPISVTVMNRGTLSTGAGSGFDVHVFADLGRPPTPSDLAFVGHLAVGPLAAGASVTVNGTLFAGALVPGNHTLWALADGHNTIAETDETNNSASTLVSVNSASSTLRTVTFDDQPGQDQVLTGQYPTGVIDWGTTQWFQSAPWKQLSTKSLSFNGAGVTSASFAFVAPRVLQRLDAYNGGTGSTTVTLSCAGQPTRPVTLPADHLTTIATGWTGTCAAVAIASTNGWDTKFDNLVYQEDSAPTCAPRPAVSVSTAKIGTGRLQVTIRATTPNGSPTNALRELQFDRAQNATIEIAGQSRGTGPVNVAVTAGATQTTFVVVRVAPGPVTVPLTVVDGCGSWRTFVGAGATAI